MKSLEGTIKPFINILLTAAFVVFAVSWGFWKFQNSPTGQVTHLQVTTAAPAAGKGLSPEQRRVFAMDLGRQFKDKGKDATVTTTGAYHTVIVIRGAMVNKALVYEMKDNATMMQDLREMGFRHLIMTVDKATWDVDLKN
jgi:hypothetical protein